MNYKSNPFNISFGRIPSLYVERIAQTDEIISDLTSESPASPVYMITGVRGCGKTVMMSAIAKKIAQNPEWIVIDLNPEVDIVKSLAASLYSQPLMSAHFIEEKIDLSLFGIGLSIKKATPISDIDSALHRMLEVVKKRKQKILVTIDEVSNTNQMKVFAASFQILLRKDFPLALIMTGLYENIYELQNEKSLTFLYRAPKVLLSPLNHTAVKRQYMKALKISEDKADRMAAIVEGYPYGFQVLGYYYWREKPNQIDDLLPIFDQHMDEYVYSKIWSELSQKDQLVLSCVAECQSGKVKDVRERCDLSSSLFSIYRERLKRKGVVLTEPYGTITLALPRLKEFIKEQQ